MKPIGRRCVSAALLTGITAFRAGMSSTAKAALHQAAKSPDHCNQAENVLGKISQLAENGV